MVLICSVNADSEAMRHTIENLKKTLNKERKAGKLWKKRYEQEKKARYVLLLIT